MKRIFYFLSAIAALALSACGSNEVDIHMVDRETKAWESAAVESMDAPALLDHLELLGREMTQATETGQFAEMHHLEIALTKALTALEDNASGDAKATIDTLKIIATKIHMAGHDQNQVMAGKLDQTLDELIARLRSQIQ